MAGNPGGGSYLFRWREGEQEYLDGHGMNSWTAEFLETGMCVVEDALSSEFCEQVIERRLSGLGVNELDPRTWPRGWQNLAATTAFARRGRAVRSRSAL